MFRSLALAAALAVPLAMPAMAETPKPAPAETCESLMKDLIKKVEAKKTGDIKKVLDRIEDKCELEDFLKALKKADLGKILDGIK
ncbi:MAG: hypothetical protein R3D31_01495 [Hyphomicrobiaceae bacterium]